MKKVIFVFFISMMVLSGKPSQAFVDDSVSGFDASGGIEFTGDYAENIDTPTWHWTSGLAGVNHDNHSYGFASRFKINDPTPIAWIDFDMLISNRDISTNVPVDFNFAIYQGDSFDRGDPNFLIPNSANKIFNSESIFLDFDTDRVRGDGSIIYNETQKYVNQRAQVNQDFEPGNYWLAYEYDGGNPGVFTSSKVVTPEPSTILLLGGGLVGAIWRRRTIL